MKLNCWDFFFLQVYYYMNSEAFRSCKTYNWNEREYVMWHIIIKIAQSWKVSLWKLWKVLSRGVLFTSSIKTILHVLNSSWTQFYNNKHSVEKFLEDTFTHLSNLKPIYNRTMNVRLIKIFKSEISML